MPMQYPEPSRGGTSSPHVNAGASAPAQGEAAQRLNAMSAEDKAALILYTTLEPCLMCLAAISFVGIKRVIYSALAEDANAEEMVARGISAETINDLLTRGPFELVPGVRREEGRELLAQMGKLAMHKCQGKNPEGEPE